MAVSNTQRTLKYLKDRGFKCAIVEKFNPYAIRAGGHRGIRIDMFGIIDIIALSPDGVIGVQSTGQDFAGHHRKLTVEKRQESLDWLLTPGTALWLVGWRKIKAKRGGKKMIWAPRIKEYELTDFEIDPFEGV